MKLRPNVLLAATALALILTGCAEADDPSPTANDTRTDRDKPSQDQLGDSPTEDETEGGEPADTVTVPVYFVGDTPQGPRLFREFRQVPSDNPLEEAAALLAAGDALDPDYRTLFPSSDNIVSIDHDAPGGMLTLLVADDSWADPSSDMSRAEARLAVQSLVYTLQGVAQARSRLQVVGQEGGDAVPLFAVDTSGGVREADPLSTLALVSVTTPEQGGTVSGTFTASGVASSFEANVPWQITQDGDVVLEGFATAEGWMDKLYPWEAEVDVSSLPPGTYTFVASTDDPSGGEGPGPTTDSKEFTIE